MRLKSAALFAVGLLCVSFWMHGGARCQNSAAAPLSIAPPSSVTDQGSPPAATCHSTGLNRWCSNPASPGVLSPAPTARGSPPQAPEVPVDPPPVILASPPASGDDIPPRASTAKRLPPAATNNASLPAAADDVSPPTAIANRRPPSATKNVSPPVATDDVSSLTATAKRPARSAVAKNSPPPADDKDAPATSNMLPSSGVDNLVPTPRVGKPSPSQEPGPDGLVGTDYGVETGEPLPVKPRSAKQSKVRPKPDIAGGPLAIPSPGDQAGAEKLNPNLTICRGC